MTAQKLIFKFDIEKDLYNIWQTCNAKPSYGYDFKQHISKEIIQICSGKEFSECKDKLKKKLSPTHKNPLVKITLESFNKAWKKIEKEYFKRLKKIMGESFCSKQVIVYLTTSPRCPYDPNKKNPYFYILFFSAIPRALATAGHELMHLQFHNMKYWHSVEEKIGYNKTHDLKEALTVLLNLEFRDLWIAPDHGYPNHVKLRKYMENEWKKKKSFDELIKKSVKWIKRNGIK
jgi:hypothetical protein